MKKNQIEICYFEADIQSIKKMGAFLRDTMYNKSKNL